MILRFSSGSATPASPARNVGFGVHADHVRAEVLLEHVHHLIAFVEAQQARVHEHARELLADRGVQQRRDDRRVDAARQPEQHAVLADLRADVLDVLGDDVLRRPVRLAAADLEHEAADDLDALLRVRDLGMELQRVDLALHVGHRGERRVRRRRDRGEPGRQLLDAIAVAHPDLEIRARLREALEQRIGARELHFRVAVLAMVRGLDGAAELRGERLHAVADAEHRRLRREDRVADLRRARGADGLRARPRE